MECTLCVWTGSEYRGWLLRVWPLVETECCRRGKGGVEALIIVQVTKGGLIFRWPVSDALRCQQRHMVISTLWPPTHGITHSNHMYVDPHPPHPKLTTSNQPQKSSSSSSSMCFSICVLLTICPICTFHTAFIQAPSLCFITSRQHSSFRKIGVAYVCRRRKKTVRCTFTLLIFSLGCVSSAGKWLRASQLSTTWVCSSVPVTMFPTALRAAVWLCRGSVNNTTNFNPKYSQAHLLSLHTRSFY